MSLPEVRAERIPITIYPDSEQASVAVAREVAALMRERTAEGRTLGQGILFFNQLPPGC